MKCGLRGGKGVKGVKAKGWGSWYQTGDQGGLIFVTTSKELAHQVSRDSLLLCKGFDKVVVQSLNIKYLYEYKYDLCVQVKK